MTTLQPCPFCGAAPVLEDCRTIWAVRCKCGACVLGERSHEPDGSEPQEHWQRIEQTAIDAWNKRAALSAPQPTADAQEHDYSRIVAIEQSARALLSASQEDAEHAAMYRWLRDRPYLVMDDSDDGGSFRSKEKLDAAIRAAMSAKETK